MRGVVLSGIVVISMSITGCYMERTELEPNRDEPTTERSSVCVDNVVYKRQQGVWIPGEDCSAEGQLCSVSNGVAECMDSSALGLDSDDVDTEESGETFIETTPNEQWLDSDETDPPEVEGFWYTRGGEGVEVYTYPTKTTITNGGLCFHGTITNDSNRYTASSTCTENSTWGAVMGFYFCASDNSGRSSTIYPIGNCPGELGIVGATTGISADISGYIIQGDLLVAFVEDPDTEASNRYIGLQTPVSNTKKTLYFQFKDGFKPCSTSEEPEGINPLNVKGIEFFVPGQIDGMVRFSICVSSLRLTANEQPSP